MDLVRVTRSSDENAPDFVKKYVNYGASVRAAQFLVLAAKARALMKGRYHVTYEDVRALYIPVLRHRILLNFHAESRPPEAGRHPEKDPGLEAGASRVEVESSISTQRRRDAEKAQRNAEATLQWRMQRVDLNAITHGIIAAAIEVHRHLGPGLLESAYQECVCYELSQMGLSFAREVHLPLSYKGIQSRLRLPDRLARGRHGPGGTQID